MTLVCEDCHKKTKTNGYDLEYEDFIKVHKNHLVRVIFDRR